MQHAPHTTHLWGNEEMGAPVAGKVLEVAQERDRLERLAQSHLVCEDAVDAIVVQRYEPVEALDLVRSHLAVDVLWRFTRG